MLLLDQGMMDIRQSPLTLSDGGRLINQVMLDFCSRLLVRLGMQGVGDRQLGIIRPSYEICIELNNILVLVIWRRFPQFLPKYEIFPFTTLEKF